MKSKNLSTIIVKAVLSIKPLFAKLFNFHFEMFKDVKEHVKADIKAIKCKTNRHNWMYSTVEIELPVHWRGHLRNQETADCDVRTCKNCGNKQHNTSQIVNLTDNWKDYLKN